MIAAKAVACREAASPAFAQYARDVVANAAALGAALESEGFRPVTGGTENHLLLVDLRDFDAELTGKEAQEVLDLAGITLNRNQIPDDPRSPFVTSGLRLGSAAETTAGMGPTRCAHRLADGPARCEPGGDEGAQAAVRDEVTGAVRVVPAVSRRSPRRADGRGRLVRPHRGDRRDHDLRAHRTRAGRRAQGRLRVRARATAPCTRASPPTAEGSRCSRVCASRSRSARSSRASHIIYVAPNELVGVVLASAVILVVGLVDDLRSMSAPAKVAGEVLAACVLYFAGATMEQLKIPFSGALVLGPGDPPAHHGPVGRSPSRTRST